VVDHRSTQACAVRIFRAMGMRSVTQEPPSTLRESTTATLGKAIHPSSGVGEAAATIAHYASLPLAFALLLYFDRHLWFMGDIFEFFARMQPGHSLSLLTPHNEHWTTIPILLDLALYKLVGLRSYLPYIGLEIAAHVLVAHLLWRWMRRLGADPWIATGLASVFLVLGAGAENLTYAFQLSYVLPIAIGLLGAFVVDRPDGSARRDALYWPFGLAAIMCSGVGVYMVALAGLIALLRRGWPATARVVSVPAAVYLAWLAVFGRGALSTTPAPKGELTLLPQYVWNGMTGAVDATTGLAGLGGVAILALAIWLYRQRGLARGRLAYVFAGPIIAVMFFAVVGVGRIALGVNESQSGRYAYTFVALVIATVGVILTRLTRQRSPLLWVALAGTVIMAVNGIGGLRTSLLVVAPAQAATRGQILAAAHLIADGAQLASGDDAKVEPARTPDLTVGVLRSMMSDGKLPLRDPVSSTDRLNAALFLQTSITARPVTGSAGEPPSVPLRLQTSSITTANGCVSVAFGGQAPQVTLMFMGPASVAITPASSGQVETRLAFASDSQRLTLPVDSPVQGGQTVYLNVTDSGIVSVLTLPPGATQLCGLTTSP